MGTLERRRVTWAMVSQSATVVSVDNGVMRLAFDNPSLVARFTTGDHAENVALAVRETLGLHVRVEAIGGAPVTAAAPVVSAAVAAATGMTPIVTATPPPAKASGRGKASAEPPLPTEAPPEDDMSDDDAMDEAGQLTGAAAVAKLLGGTVVDD